MGTTDANGVYKYAETDLASTFSTLLNTGQDSISAALGAVKASTTARLSALESDSGWVSVPTSSILTSTFYVRKIGNVVYTRGTFSGTAVTLGNGTYFLLGTIPAGYRPSSSIQVSGSASIAAPLQFSISSTTGEITVRTFAGPVTTGTAPAFSIAGNVWIV